jgi:CDP-paratose synthetase
MTKSILLTGATGFLGSHLAKALLAAGHQVAAVKRPASSQRRLAAVHADLRWVDSENLNLAALGPIDAIIHTATCYGRNHETVDELLLANTRFPLRLMDAACRHGVGAFINSDTTLPPYLSPYALSKRHFLMWGEFYATHHPLRFVNVRLEQFYGAHDDPTKFTGYVIKGCVDQVEELRLTAGEQRRDFIHIDDAVAAYLTLMDTTEPGLSSFDVGSGQAVSIRQFVETVHRLANTSTRLAFGTLPYRAGEVMHAEANIARLAALGWRCRHDLESGLRQVIEEEKT